MSNPAIIHPKLQNHYKRFSFIKDFYNYNPKNVLDIGALDGRWSRAMSQIFPDTKFLMIEANKEMEKKLSSTNIDYIIAALSDKVKETNYYKIGGGAGNALYVENYGIKPKIEKIKTTTLDSIFDQNIKFNIIKLDVQGSELDILKGGLNLFKKADFILTECNIVEYNFGAPYFIDQVNFFNSYGFQLIDIVDLIYSPHLKDKGKLVQVDALFKNNAFKI